MERRVSKSISLRTDAEGVLNLKLQFTVDVKAPIEFIPNSRLVISTVEGEEARKRVLLRRTDGKALEVSTADTRDPNLVAVAEEVEAPQKRDGIEASPGDVWLELILPEQSPPLSRTGKLRLVTNDPVAGSFDIPFAMRVRPLIEFRPAGVRLWATPSGTGDGYSGFVSLNRNREGSFVITAIDVSDPDVFSASAVSTEASVRQTVRVELSPEVRPDDIGGTIEGWVVIKTDDPLCPTVEIPVVVAANRGQTRRPFQTRRTVGE